MTNQEHKLYILEVCRQSSVFDCSGPCTIIYRLIIRHVQAGFNVLYSPEAEVGTFLNF